jgi:hypothetical protein
MIETKGLDEVDRLEAKQKAEAKVQPYINNEYNIGDDNN